MGIDEVEPGHAVRIRYRHAIEQDHDLSDPIPSLEPGAAYDQPGIVATIFSFRLHTGQSGKRFFWPEQGQVLKPFLRDNADCSGNIQDAPFAAGRGDGNFIKLCEVGLLRRQDRVCKGKGEASK